MMKCVVILLVIVSGPAVSVLANGCPEGADGIPCLGSSIARNVVQQVLGVSATDTKPFVLWDGIELVHVKDSNVTFDKDTESKGRDISTSMFKNLRKLISSYELRVRMSDLVQGAANDVDDDDDFEEQARKGGSGLGVSGFGGSGLGGGGNKGGKKGGNGMAMAMFMMAGMMKIMALGALGALAMKALTVSSLAFMLSLIVGLKKLLSKKDDDDGGHYVQVVGGHGGGHGGGGDYHRRAFVVQDTRSAHQLAYRGQTRK